MLISFVRLALAFELTGCAGHMLPRGGASIEDGVCTQPVSVPQGFVEVQDTTLRTEVLAKPGEGKLCNVVVLEARVPVTVYRLFNRAQPATQGGRWWTLDRPTQPLAKLRERLVVCVEWSPLDALVSCHLRVGAHVALGPGQSVQCADGTLIEHSAALQLYVPNDTRSRPQVMLVEECEEQQPPPR